MCNSRMLFDRLGILGFTITGAYISGFIYSIAIRPENISQWVYDLNFSGILLEIFGAVVGAYTIRNVIIRGGFSGSGFTQSGFTTDTSEIRINRTAGGLSIMLIIIGLWLQLFGLYVSQFDS
jgi:hypothetical protein